MIDDWCWTIDDLLNVFKSSIVHHQSSIERTRPMLHRRDFLARTLQGSSLLALGSVVPEFVAQTARAAAPGKDTVLVLIEMAGGNDGLNTVIPFRDDAYQKARPTLK